jgi:transcriptional regulator with XRE-family HTH domain
MEISSRGRKRLTLAQKRRVLASYRRSPLTQRDFAVRAGISVSALQSWLRQSPAEVEASDPRPFIAVPNLLPPAGSQRFSYRLELPGGVNLEIARGFTPAEVTELCRILQSL